MRRKKAEHHYKRLVKKILFYYKLILKKIRNCKTNQDTIKPIFYAHEIQSVILLFNPISKIMATVIEIANDLAKSFVVSENKKFAARRMVIEISSLAYTDSKKPIEFDVKASIIQLIFELISGQRPFLEKDGKIFQTTPKDGFLFSGIMQHLLKRLDNVPKEKIEGTELNDSYYMIRKTAN